MTEKPPASEQAEHRGSHNELGYRNVDEEGEHDERGSQGPGAGEPDADAGTGDDV